MGKPEPKKKVRIPVAIGQDFLAWIDQMTEEEVFANTATPYIVLQLI